LTAPIFETYKALILNILLLLLALSTIAVAEVPTACTAVLPYIAVGCNKFGFAIF
jgi:hypothetical protein